VAWFIASDTHSASSFPNPTVRIVPGSLWKTVSMALCFLNKRKFSARLLIVQKQAYPHDYQLALHSIIAAQHLKASIDGLALVDSEILAQACSFTGGTYIRQTHSGVLQTLLQVFLQPKQYRQSNIFNLRPKCTCCDREVDKAYVCSACLAIYCEVAAECSRCESRFLFIEFGTEPI
jgi:transcription initiation factor TFIIH subunit 3